MSFNSVQFSAAVAVLLAGCCGFELTSDHPDDKVKYACVDGELVLPWSYNATPGDDVQSIQWFFLGRSQQIIAMFSNGHFSPMASFANRVQHISDAGLSLSHVTIGDTGNYSVEISGQEDNGTFFTYRHTVKVEITGMSDDYLNVVVEPTAVSNSTGQWSLVLSCGNFTYHGDPPFDMEWLTPSGVVPLQSSDGYTDGHFQLHVTSGGDYTCRVPQNATAEACLRNTSSQNATVHVDRMEARMTLMEAQVKQLQEENQQLKAKVTQQVAFNVMVNKEHTSGVIVFGEVYSNYGNGYSSSTGIFTAPVAGLYFFMLTTKPIDIYYYPDALVRKEGSPPFCYVNAPVDNKGELGSCGGTIHLRVGDRVWAESKQWLDSSFTQLSGFLISSD